MPDIIYHCRPATDAETSVTVERLKAHTEACIGRPVQYEPFAVTAYQKDMLVGSIIGKIYSGWMHMDLVWVDEKKRGTGVGKTLLQNAIAEAGKRNLTGIEVWTQSWQAPEFYLHNGFTEIAVLDDFLPGYKRHVLQYKLKAGVK